jgi:hypothetical protein
MLLIAPEGIEIIPTPERQHAWKYHFFHVFLQKLITAIFTHFL